MNANDTLVVTAFLTRNPDLIPVAALKINANRTEPTKSRFLQKKLITLQPQVRCLTIATVKLIVHGEITNNST